METKLTDFSLEELNTLLSSVAAYMVDKESQAEYYERYNLHELDPFKKAYGAAHKEIENARTLIVQITTAFDIVKERETANAN